MAKRKYKTKLQKLSEEYSHIEYETTYEDCEKWIRILNRELFGGRLEPPDEIDIRWRRCNHAYHLSFTDTKNPSYKYTRLCMNKRYKNKKFFVEILAHELVHHHQFLHGEPLGHGPSFFQWEDRFNQKGLRLLKGY